jgi:DNA-binding MarR family transcriptional regulator
MQSPYGSRPTSPSSAGRRTLAKAEYEALANFRHALREFLAFSEAAARQVGLTPQQHQAMLAIKGFPDRNQVTIGELAERLMVRHHSAVEMVDRLCETGLTRRSPDPADRRRVLVSLTEQAELLLEQLSAVHWEELRRLRPVLAMLLASVDHGPPPT